MIDDMIEITVLDIRDGREVIGWRISDDGFRFEDVYLLKEEGDDERSIELVVQSRIDYYKAQGTYCRVVRG